jgi:hypothetical protein
VSRWSVIPAQITAGHHLVTLVTAMFMHAASPPPEPPRFGPPAAVEP